jgi:hypothetical protein
VVGAPHASHGCATVGPHAPSPARPKYG